MCRGFRSSERFGFCISTRTRRLEDHTAGLAIRSTRRRCYSNCSNTGPGRDSCRLQFRRTIDAARKPGGDLIAQAFALSPVYALKLNHSMH